MMRSFLRTVLFLGGAGAAAFAPAAAAKEPGFFPVDSVRAGMTGIGLTVFQGTRIDTFGVTILGVLKGHRPGASLILARAEGSYLQGTGIIGGMSGSPVYLGGRLVGALAYTWSFLKEPIAGITPIGEMLGLLPAPGSRSPGDDPERRLGWLPPGGARHEPWGESSPIVTPLVLSGFTPEAIRYLEPWLAERGFVVSAGGAQEPGGDCGSIVPGSAVGVQLVRGDWSAAAIGTATHRDGDRVLAFGHPFVGMGWVRFPFTAAKIHTVFPNQQVSTKIGSPTADCGTLLADRAPGVAGEIGESPSMVPVSVEVRGTGGISRRYRFEVARSRLLTPSLVAAAAVNSISESLNDVGFATVRYDLRYFMNGGRTEVNRGNAYLTSSPLTGVGEEVSQSLALLLSEHYRPSVLDSVRIDVEAASGLDAAKILSIRVRPTWVSPGDSVQVEATIRRSRGGVEVLRAALRLPVSTPEGEVTVRVCDGEETDKWDRERAPELFQPDTFDQLVRIIEAERRLDRLYVQLYRSGTGATVKGGEISQPPGSVLRVLQASDKAGAAAETKGATLDQISMPLGYVVRGCESTKLDVVPDRLR
jgi:hypothetical protein